MIETFVSNIFDGYNKAYIYLWLSKKHKVLYVGMTNSRTGTLGRASNHVDKDGTLRKRFSQYLGYDINLVDDFKLLSFQLPQKREYISAEKSYREAIEYLIQKELQVIKGNLTPNFKIISWVRESPRTNNIKVKKLANTIVLEFRNAYDKL